MLLYREENVNDEYLLHASTVMEKHKATRNTALTSAPSTSALAQPNVFFDHFLGDIYSTTNSLMKGKQYSLTCSYNYLNG